MIDKALTGRDWITGTYSIADIAIAPWLNGLDFYGANDLIGWNDYENILAYWKRFYDRLAVERSKTVPAPAD